jgi:hypothetical protein
MKSSPFSPHLPLSLSQPGRQTLCAISRFRDEPHGELAHDGQELGLHSGIDSPAAIERASDQPLQALNGQVQPGHSRIVRKRDADDGRLFGGPFILDPTSRDPLPPPGRKVHHFTHGWIVAATSDTP